MGRASIRRPLVAFETAIQALHNWGVVDPPRDAVARAIIGFAKAGERDPMAEALPKRAR
jgi:hypothetical protein